MIRRWLVAPLLLVGFATVPAVADERNESFGAFYARLSVTPPASSQLTVCYGFDCRRRRIVAFSRDDRQAVIGIFARARSSPQAEREAVSRAVAWFDRRVGPLIGTTRRVARANAFTSDKDRNFDCIDTSTNTTSLLLLFADWGVLRHHKVGSTAFRGNILAGQTMHNTAVLIERASGREWSIDMWTTKYGQRAEVMPVEQWLRTR